MNLSGFGFFRGGGSAPIGTPTLQQVCNAGNTVAVAPNGIAFQIIGLDTLSKVVFGNNSSNGGYINCYDSSGNISIALNAATGEITAASLVLNSSIQSISTSLFNINNVNTSARMNFGLMSGTASSGAEIFGAYFSVFGNTWSNATQRGSAEFVFDSRNADSTALGFGITCFDGTNWTRYLRIANPTGRAILSPDSSKLTISSGLFNAASIVPSITTSGTAGYRGLFISVFEQSVAGSGNRFLIDVGTNTAASGAGSHTTRFSVDATGLTNIFGTNAANLTVERSTTANTTVLVKNPGFNNWIGQDGAGNFGISRTSADLGNFADMLKIDRASGKLNLRTGANTSVGSATLVNGTVTISNTCVTASSVIVCTNIAINASAAIGTLTQGTIVAGASFVINSRKQNNPSTLETADNSTFLYLIIN